MPPADSALLVRWFNRRDPQAFRELTSRYAGMVLATSTRILGDATEAEDVTQECFERLARMAEGPKGHLGAWLHRVATNRALDRIRQARRRVAREKRYAAEHATAVLHAAHPAQSPLDDLVARALEVDDGADPAASPARVRQHAGDHFRTVTCAHFESLIPGSRCGSGAPAAAHPDRAQPAATASPIPRKPSTKALGRSLLKLRPATVGSTRTAAHPSTRPAPERPRSALFLTTAEADRWHGQMALPPRVTPGRVNGAESTASEPPSFPRSCPGARLGGAVGCRRRSGMRSSRRATHCP